MLANIPASLLSIQYCSPRGSGNIGSIARAMKNIGAKPNWPSWAKREREVFGRGLWRSTAGTSSQNAKCYDTMREAIADCCLVVGTTCRSGLYRRHSQAPREVATDIVAAARNGKVALIFGPEDHGLSNKDLEHCQLLMTIPTHPDYQSLNVAQAAVICLYELYLAALIPAQSSAIQRAPS